MANKAVAFQEPLATVDAVLSPGPGGFVGIRPYRLADTRLGIGGTRLSAGVPRTLSVLGSRPGTVPAAAAAVALNVTVANAPSGYLTIWPADSAPPATSNINFSAGQTVANAVTTALSPAGAISIIASADAEVIIDVLGWYASPAAITDEVGRRSLIPSPGGGFFGITPQRISDSRHTASFSAGESRIVNINPGIDMHGATIAAVVLNLTAVAPQAAGYASVVGGTEVPESVSSLNFNTTHPAVANQVTARVDADGNVRVFASAPVHLLVDLLGFYTTGPTIPGGYTPVPSRRLMDTRSPSSVGNAFYDLATSSWDLIVASTAEIPATAAAVVLNLTAVGPSVGGFFTVWPDGGPRRETSTLNVERLGVRANAVTVGLGSNNGVSIYTNTDAAFLVDAAGWFSSPFVTR